MMDGCFFFWDSKTRKTGIQPGTTTYEKHKVIRNISNDHKVYVSFTEVNRRSLIRLSPAIIQLVFG